MDLSIKIRKRLTILFAALIYVGCAQSVGGLLTGSATVCSTSNSGSLSVVNYTGSIQRWEFASTSNGPWSVMAHTFSVFSYINLSQTTWFRVVVQNGAFAPAFSNAVSVVVVNPAVGQLVASANTVCVGVPITFSVTGSTVNTANWVSSTNNWISSTTSSSTLTTLTTTLSQTTQLAALLTQAPCSVVTTNSLTIHVVTPVIPGTVTAPPMICSGSSVNLSVNNAVSQIINWESTSSGTTAYQVWSNSSGINSFTLPLLNTTCFKVKLGNGVCADVYTAPTCVTVQPMPVGGWATGPSSVCTGTSTLVLTVSAYSGSINYWEKQLVGASTWTPISTIASSINVNGLGPSALYRAVVGSSSCPVITSTSHTLTVYPLPNLSATIANVCNGHTLQPINSSSNATGYVWRLNNGATWLGAAPVFSLTGMGAQTITLIGTTSQGCQDSLYLPIQIHSNPVVQLYALDTVCVSQQVLHANNSSVFLSTIVGSTLNFGNGTSTQSLPASHTYSASGYFVRKLIVQSAQGCIDSLSRSIWVRSINPPTINYQGECTMQAVQFSASNGNGTCYWQFGDGSISTSQLTFHSYSLAGTYTVGLQISDGLCTATTFTPITIYPVPTVTLIPGAVCAQTPLTFSANFQPSFATVHWQAGDGFESTQTNFQHAYSASGFYPTQLKLSTSPQCSVLASVITTVNPLPRIEWSTLPICEKDSIQLTLNGTHTALKWIMDDKDTIVGNNNYYRPEEKGRVPLLISATNQWGCTSQFLDTLIIKEGPSAMFEKKDVCEGDTAVIFNQSSSASGEMPAFSWLFSDGWVSSIAHPKRLLPFGNYAVKLQITDKNGCKDSRLDTLHVYRLPHVDFKIENKCIGDSMYIQNYAQGINFINNYRWYCNDTLYSTAFSPLWRSNLAGEHHWQLRVNDVKGCSSDLKKAVTINSPQRITRSFDTLIDKGHSVFVSFDLYKTVNWLPLEQITNPTAMQQWLSPLQSTCYTVNLSDSNDCEQVYSFCVDVDTAYHIHPYALVTADGNGYNDVWMVENIEVYPDNGVEIINQQGVLVYSERGYRNTWDGKNNKGELLPEGTYYYRIGFMNSKKVYKGYVLLVR